MIYLKDFKQGKLLYEALDSDVRLGILEELLREGELNLAYFARKFNVSNGAITAHIKKLHEAGLIDITTSSGIRGTQKICCLATDKIIVDFMKTPHTEGRVEAAHIDIGHYVGYDIHPTCGLVTRENIIGRFDDPACFSYPERIRAGLLWLSWGYVEYLVPNYLTDDSELLELQFSMEIASEAPGYSAYYPSDIHFSVNGHTLGYYTSKGENNDRTGTCNPSWWFGNLGQYGKKILIVVNNEGSFISGMKVSDVKLSDLDLQAGKQILFRIFVPEDAVHRGGFSLFGKGFGDYDEGIVCNFVRR
ncbi:MAG: helix-turn-helix domain-containing protein [Clostridia bacterium]|nr:helix-turn-helix domain-containing protein [Clostridia bacterium]